MVSILKGHDASCRAPSLALAITAVISGCGSTDDHPRETRTSTQQVVQDKKAPPQVRTESNYGVPDFDARGVVKSTLSSTSKRASVDVAVRALASADPQGTVVRYSEATGAVSRVTRRGAPLTAASAAPAEDVALQFLKNHGALFALSASDLATGRFVRNFLSKHNGVRHLTLQFQVEGLDVFESDLRINVDRLGRLINASGQPIPDAAKYINEKTPRISGNDAVLNAARETHVSSVARSNVGRLIYFPLDMTRLRLAWDVTFEDGDTPNVYHALVDAVDGRMLWRKLLTHYQHGEVYVDDSPIPNLPAGTSTGVVARVDAPFDGSDFFAGSDVHFDWWAGNAQTTTTSNNVDAYADRDGDNIPDPWSRPSAGIGLDFTFPVDLTQQPDAYRDAAIANLFYWNNRLHDFFYNLGFDEVAGNFQTDNFGLGGFGGDAVLAEAQDNRDSTPPSLCNANMFTPADGTPPRMQMYLCNLAAPERDSSFDNVVIAHEYTHGVHSRLLTTSGSQRGDEGWADFFGIGIVLQAGDPYDGEYGVGNYAFNRVTGRGIRDFPYSTDTSVFALRYADLPNRSFCTVRVCGNDDTRTCIEDDDCSGGNCAEARICQTHAQCQPPNTAISEGVCETQSHYAGSIWANALHLVRSNIIAKRGFAVGLQTANQIVIDAMKLSPGNPTFLDGRDDILAADQVGFSGENRCLIWDAFAKMGMGFSASTTGVADLYPVEGYDLPPSCTPEVDLHAPTDLGETCPGQSTARALQIGNAGSGELIVTSVERISGSPSIVVDSIPALPQIIDAGDSVDFTVRCSPTAATNISATIRVRSNDPINPSQDIVYTCSGTPLDLQPPPGVVASFCTTEESVLVGEATVTGPCAADVSGQVISTNGMPLSVPLDVIDGRVVLNIGSHVIRWIGTDGFQTEAVYQTVTVGPAILASNTYQVRDRASVEDAVGNPAAVLNSGSGITSVGGDGATVGAIIAGGNVDIAWNGYVYGDITAVGSVDVNDPSKHFGNVIPVSSVELLSSPDLPTFPPPTGGDQWINPGTDLSLPPGSYGQIGVNGNPDPNNAAIVRFSAGDYFFTNLYFNSSGLIVVGEPGTRIFVSGNVTFNTSIVTAVSSGELAPVMLGVPGQGSLALYAPFTGLVVAPQRDLVMGTANGMTFTGSFYARSIDVTPDSVLVCDPTAAAQEPETCENSVLDPGETDIDCGGPQCNACGDGATCSLGNDCLSKVCTANVCQVPTCTDGERNGTETGEDCGGLCPACPVTCNSYAYQAESMFHSTGNAWWQGGWNIHSNGYISTTHDFSAGLNMITVSAFGQQALGVLPHMLVTVGGVTVNPTSGVNVTTDGFNPYQFTFNAAGGPQEIRVIFDNDVSGWFGDRNLIVRTVDVSCP